MTNQNEQTENGRPSFLDQILSEWASPSVEASSVQEDIKNISSWEEIGVAPSNLPSSVPPPPVPPKKKTPLTAGQIFKMIGALFLVTLILFGSFLAYIVFNPGQAKFFLTFGISLVDVATLLQRLVNGIFGSITFVLCVLWAVTLFRAIITKKEFKQKKTVATILAIFFGILLFSNIGFWAYLFNKIGASDFVRPNGWVTVYDNDLYLSTHYKDVAEITDFSNIIGPITLRYDLSSDAKFASKSINIESYEIDYDGDGTMDKEWTDPENDKSVFYVYSKKGKIAPKGYYIGTDRLTKEPAKVAIGLEPINIAGIVDIRNSDTTVTFDGRDLVKLWKLEWFLEDDLNIPASRDEKFTTAMQKGEKIACLTVQNDRKKKSGCDRIFFLESKKDATISADIISGPDAIDPLKYNFSLTGVTIKNGSELQKVKWFLNDTTLLSQDENFTYKFLSFGTYKITAELTDGAGNMATVSSKLAIGQPLQLVKNSSLESLLRVEDESGKTVLAGTYDRSIDAYRIADINIPSKFIFQATDVRVRNEGFDLYEAQWMFDKTEKKGLEVDYEFVEEKRYEVTVTYTFKKRGDGETLQVAEHLIFEWKKSELAPSMNVQAENADIDNLYAPARVTFDASASVARSGKISKFIFDFGEGRPASEGDAIQTYEYRIPGEYIVELTVVKEDGSKAKISRKIVVKEMPRKMSITPSVSSAKVGYSVDFASSVVGQIDRYEWDFGDGTSVSNESNPTHTYATAWEYQVKLTATYGDGTIRTAEITMPVTAQNE